jgi:hypothetical protein
MMASGIRQVDFDEVVVCPCFLDHNTFSRVSVYRVSQLEVSLGSKSFPPPEIGFHAIEQSIQMEYGVWSLGMVVLMGGLRGH